MHSTLKDPYDRTARKYTCLFVCLVCLFTPPTCFFSKVSYELRRLASRKLPNVDDVANMASSVEEFTNRLIDPLKSDINLGLRARFESCFDDVMENAIAFEQKKVRTEARFFNIYSTKYLTARWCRIWWVTILMYSESLVLGSLIISFDLLCYLFTRNSSIVIYLWPFDSRLFVGANPS